MNWISHFKKIGIKVKKIIKKQPVSQQETDWKNCPQCKKISYFPDLIANSYICECSYHFDCPPKFRLDSLFDSTYEIIEAPKNINPDPLNFEVEGKYKYSDKIKKYRKVTNQDTALLAASGLISGMRAVVVVFNPLFGGGRFGNHENEYFLHIANFAVRKKVDFWLCCYASSGMDVHGGVTSLSGMPKSIIAMNEIKQANIVTFALASRGTSGGTYASSFFMHDIIIVESNSTTDILFSGKRVTSNILKGTDQIPEDFGTGPGVMKSGLADIKLENRKELKGTITKLANIILKKVELKSTNVKEAYENQEDFKKTASTTS
tara:strand:+ start:313 stop:1272 length:960 start_codon:yes stop_codon:yes gene_type:complete